MSQPAWPRDDLGPADRFAALWEENPQSPPDAQAFVARCGNLSLRNLADILLVDNDSAGGRGGGFPPNRISPPGRKSPPIAGCGSTWSTASIAQVGRGRRSAAATIFFVVSPDLSGELARQVEVSHWLQDMNFADDETCNLPTDTGRDRRAGSPPFPRRRSIRGRR